MKLIEKLSGMIEDEIDGARCYVKTALEYKGSKPELARVMYNLSMQEMQHMTDLHALVENVIDEYRREHGEPPADMQAVYDYLHDQHIEDATEVRVMQQMYNAR